MVFSNFFQGLGDVFSVDRPVTSNSGFDSDDNALKTKNALTGLGHMNNQSTDIGSGLKSFQADNGLKIDGIMNPGGPTENALSQTLTQQGIGNSDLLAKRDEPAKPEIKVTKPISSKPDAQSFTASASFDQTPKPPRPKKPKIDPLTGLPDPLANSPVPKKSKAEMGKLWEQAAELQKPKPKSAIIPEGETVDARIQSIMKDPRYLKKLEKPIVDHVVKQFERAYPGEVQYDETGKMIQPTPVISPEDVEPFDPDGELQNDQGQTPYVSSTSHELQERIQADATDANPQEFSAYPQRKTGQPIARSSPDTMGPQITLDDVSLNEAASYELNLSKQDNGYQIAQNSTAFDVSEEKTAQDLSFKDVAEGMNADTQEAISPYHAYQELEFDPNGDGQRMVAVKNPIDGGKAYLYAGDANEMTDKLYKDIEPHNNEADAFRHAYWSYIMTMKIGTDEAKRAGDSHEITKVNPEGERLMDLYNNRIGRELAIDPKNKGRPPEEVIREAIKDGKLRVHPFRLLGERDFVPSPFGN